ncbi:MAG: hypothetical protein WBB33_00510 [Candidatus Saccharimonadales bacterium]
MDSFVVTGATWLGDKAPVLKLSESGCVGDEIPTPPPGGGSGTPPTPPGNGGGGNTPGTPPSVPGVTPNPPTSGNTPVTPPSTPVVKPSPPKSNTPTKATVVAVSSETALPPTTDKSDAPASLNLGLAALALAAISGAGLAANSRRRNTLVLDDLGRHAA